MVDVPDQGPDPLDEHGQPAGTVASVKFMLTQADKANLRARGLTDDEIAKLTPAQAEDILAQPT